MSPGVLAENEAGKAAKVRKIEKRGVKQDCGDVTEAQGKKLGKPLKRGGGGGIGGKGEKGNRKGEKHKAKKKSAEKPNKKKKI